MGYKHHLLSVLMAALVVLGACRPALSADDNSKAYWQSGYQKLAALGRGFVVWETSRTGRWRIWRIELDGSNPHQISRDEADRDHYCPHISPDGKRIAYLSYPKDHNTYEAFDHPFDGVVPLHLMSSDGKIDRMIAPNARAYGEDRGVVWLNDRELIYIGGDSRTYRLNVETGEQSLLLDAPPQGQLPRLLNPQLQFATSGDPNFSPYDPKTRTVHWRTKEDGCQPYFSRSGVWGFWMGGAGGPINSYRLGTGEVAHILRKDDFRMPKDRNYLYFPMLSASGNLFAFAASPGVHDHFTADYDVFVAPIDPNTLELTGDPVRYTFDPGCDRFPDVFLDNSTPVKAHLGLTAIQKSTTAVHGSREQSRPSQTGAWPLDQKGLVFLWEAGNRPNRVGSARAERICQVTPRGGARLNRRYAMVIRQGAYTAEESAAALLNACKRTNQLTLEATLVSGNENQSGPARIMTFSSSPTSRNFTLGQDGNELVFRLRTPQTGENGVHPEAPVCPIQAGRPVHLILTYSPGQLVAYCNGQETLRTNRVQGDFSNWAPQHLLFGDEWNGERQWAGALEGIAIYNRVLSPEEAEDHARAYRALQEARKPAPRLQVEAVLMKKSKIPTLKEIQPYKNALALYEYRVEKVSLGHYPTKMIRVAHWVILNGETLPVVAAKVGQKANLILEPFDENPQLASQYLSDSLSENWNITSFFDIGNP